MTTKDAEQRVSSFKITSIVYHQPSDDEDIKDDEIFNNPVCKWSNFCNKCNQFITTTHHRNNRSTQTAGKILYTVYPNNSPRDGHTPLGKEFKVAPYNAKIAAGNSGASHIQSSMSEFNFPSTFRNTSIHHSPSLSSIPYDQTKNWPTFHICPTTTSSITTTSLSNTNNSSLSSSVILNKLFDSIPFNASSDSTVDDPLMNTSSDCTVSVNEVTKQTKSQIVPTEYTGVPTEILFARSNMSARENFLFNMSSPNISRLFETSNIPFDYTPNEGMNYQSSRSNNNSGPSISSIPCPILQPQHSFPCFRKTPDELRPAIRHIANSGSVLSVPRFYSEPIFSTSAEKTSPKLTQNTKSQYILKTNHNPNDSEPRFFSTYSNEQCQTVSSGNMAPIASPSIYIPGLCNKSTFTPFNNIVVNVNPISNTSIKLANSVQNSNNLEIFIQSLDTSGNSTPSKMNVDKKSSPIKVVASGKNKYCTLCLRSFCGQPGVFDENYESETISRQQNCHGSNYPISIPSDLYVGSDVTNQNLLHRRLDPLS